MNNPVAQGGLILPLKVTPQAAHAGLSTAAAEGKATLPDFASLLAALPHKGGAKATPAQAATKMETEPETNHDTLKNGEQADHPQKSSVPTKAEASSAVLDGVDGLKLLDDVLPQSSHSRSDRPDSAHVPVASIAVPRSHQGGRLLSNDADLPAAENAPQLRSDSSRPPDADLSRVESTSQPISQPKTAGTGHPSVIRHHEPRGNAGVATSDSTSTTEAPTERPLSETQAEPAPRQRAEISAMPGFAPTGESRPVSVPLQQQTPEDRQNGSKGVKFRPVPPIEVAGGQSDVSPQARSATAMPPGDHVPEILPVAQRAAVSGTPRAEAMPIQHEEMVPKPAVAHHEFSRGTPSATRPIAQGAFEAAQPRTTVPGIPTAAGSAKPAVKAPQQRSEIATIPPRFSAFPAAQGGGVPQGRMSAESMPTPAHMPIQQVFSPPAPAAGTFHTRLRAHEPSPRSAMESNAPTLGSATPVAPLAPQAAVIQAAQPVNPASAPQQTDSAGQRDGVSPLLSSTEPPEVFNWDSSRITSTPHGPAATPRAEMAAHVARQLVEVMGQAGNRPIEIALSPVELGRVRMGISKEDGKITINILAERPDTLDLMRRHIDQLGQTFRSMGYEQISFSFGQGEQSGGQADAKQHDTPTSVPGDRPALDTAPAQDSPAIINLDRTATSGVDIRL